MTSNTGKYQSEVELRNIESKILNCLAISAEVALTLPELEKGSKMDRKKLWSAIRRLEHKKVIFRFHVDSDPCFVLWKFRKVTFVETSAPVLSPHWAEMYSFFGTSQPVTLARTPQMMQSSEDDQPSYNRYLDDDDQGEVEVGENSCIHTRQVGVPG